MHQHLIDWLKAEFNVSVFFDGNGYTAHAGEYDEGVKCGYSSDTVFGAALDYGSCYEGALYDKLCALEAGEPQAIEQFRELVGV